jgi:pyruvate/2-oxoglutarate dehydrogenase complex dihydrolipoamide dehydrogenase (E3) component
LEQPVEEVSRGNQSDGKLMKTKFDAIVIGSGQSGPFLAMRMAAAGQRVAIVERGRFGGTCVNTGCIPTKTLVASAYVAHMTRRAREFGVEVAGTVGVDMKRVKARKDEISGKSRSGLESSLRSTLNCTVYQGHAQFESPNEVRVGDQSLTAQQIFVNVGGRATIPSLPGVTSTPYLTNSTLLDLDVLPRHLIIMVAVTWDWNSGRFSGALAAR